LTAANTAMNVAKTASNVVSTVSKVADLFGGGGSGGDGGGGDGGGGLFGVSGSIRLGGRSVPGWS